MIVAEHYLSQKRSNRFILFDESFKLFSFIISYQSVETSIMLLGPDETQTDCHEKCTVMT